MQITSRFVFSLVACELFGGCAGVSSTRIVGNTVGAAGGALLGKTLGKGNSQTTALGAGGGLLLSETLQAGSTSHAKKSYAEGYEKGRSDSIKRQYQALNERSDSRRKPTTRRICGCSTCRCRSGSRTASSSRRARPLFASRNNPNHHPHPSMKLILSLAALLFAAPFVRAQVVVANPISDILSQTMQVEDIAKTVEMINN